MANAPAERLACLIVARNLGDAAIQSGFLRALSDRGYAQEYLVWTRPQVASLFEDIPRCEIVCSQFPVGTSKQFGGLALLQLFWAALRIRRRKPSVTLDLIGDIRERIFARLAGTPRHLHIGWAVDHPFARLIRNPLGRGRPLVSIPKAIPNVYSAYNRMLAAVLAVDVGSAPFPHRERILPILSGGITHVGLHPFASQECKLWPTENWQQLVRGLLDKGANVTAFAAPSERELLERMFHQFGERITLVSGNISNFSLHVSGLDILVGLDSFAIHIARLQGIRSVTINAGNPPDLWAVPNGRMLASSGGCQNYPCSNIPMCKGSEHQYICVKSITVRQVFDAIYN
jgi:heptosyltransferase-3